MNPNYYFLLFNSIEGLGPRRQNRLLEYFQCPERAWKADVKVLQSVSDIPPRVIENLIRKRSTLDPEVEYQKLKNMGIGVVFLNEPGYPSLLKEVFDPPKVLYYMGNPELLKKRMVGIVGARKASNYGLTIAEAIARGLASAGVCVVSGMARGIDSAAHRGALSEQGDTVAVLGCGVDVVYPRENRSLMNEIIDKGLIISEFSPATAPIPGNFPQRNRIISGLSEGILIIEAADKSGSLITADFALEQGRDVFAVPGQVTNPLNTGAHRLIKQGAKLVESAADVLEELGIEHSDSINKQKKEISGLTLVEQRIYNIISDDPVNSEVIIEQSGISSPDVLSALLVMELKGLVRQLPGQLYVRCEGGMF